MNFSAVGATEWNFIDFSSASRQEATPHKTVIFINGCFWHGHEGCKHFVLPKSNIEYWESKILGNQQRDKEVILKLQQQGWRVIIVWECEIQKSQLPRIIDKIDSIIKCP